jgi:hypothetical protein
MNKISLLVLAIAALATPVVIERIIYKSYIRKADEAIKAETKAEIEAMRQARIAVEMKINDGYYRDKSTVVIEQDFTFYRIAYRNGF